MQFKQLRKVEIGRGMAMSCDCPLAEDIKTMALHLQVYVYAMGASQLHETVVGEVFVPSLVPFATCQWPNFTQGQHVGTARC